MFHRLAHRVESRAGLPVGGVAALEVPALLVEPGARRRAVAGDAPVARAEFRHPGLPDVGEFLARRFVLALSRIEHRLLHDGR